MRGVIKGVLAEELKNSLGMKKAYEQAITKLPRGTLTKRKIGKQEYYYLARRVGDKIKHEYKGKMSEAEIRKYEDAKVSRAKYRKLLAQVKKQIKFLRGVLRGKESI